MHSEITDDSNATRCRWPLCTIFTACLTVLHGDQEPFLREVTGRLPQLQFWQNCSCCSTLPNFGKVSPSRILHQVKYCRRMATRVCMPVRLRWLKYNSQGCLLSGFSLLEYMSCYINTESTKMVNWLSSTVQSCGTCMECML